MHIGEKELTRLINYAEALGAVVIWKDPKDLETPAQLILTEPPIIELKRYKRLNYIDFILNVLHELGHYQDWLNRGKRTPSHIFTKEHHELNQSEREIVYMDEKKAARIAISIAKKLNLMYPKMHRIKADAAYTRWYYKKFLTTGDYPTPLERCCKNTSLKAKYEELAKNEST